MIILQGFGGGNLIAEGYLETSLAPPSGPDPLYKQIADSYASAQECLNEAATQVQLPAPIILAVHETNPDLDLLVVFYNTGQAIQRQLSDLSRYKSAVVALSRSVLAATGDASIDELIIAENFKVRQAWADISAFAGYPISSQNIEG